MAEITVDYTNVRNPQMRKFLEENFKDVLFSTSDGHDHDGTNSKSLSPAATVENDSVTTAKIVNEAVTAPKIGDAAVTTDKIADDAVTAAKIADASIVVGLMAANSIDSAQYVDGSIDPEHFAAGAVDTTALGADCVVGTKIADNAVDSEHIVAGAIDTAHFAAGAVDATAIAANAVITAKILDDNVTNAKLANMTRGTIKVGGADDAPTDLDANNSGYILVGDGTDLNSVAVSGDITLATTGATAIGAGKVTTAMLAATATPNAKAIVAAHEADIPVTGNGDLALTIANAAETNALAVPTFAGQAICISADTVAGSGSRTVTVASAVNEAGNNTILFDAAGEFIKLRGIKLGATFAWRVLAIDGATLSTVA